RRVCGGHQITPGRGMTTQLPQLNPLWQPALWSADDIRGGCDPYEYMALAPRSRMDPSPRSFAPDAHACIMVLVRMDQPNTSLRRDIASKANSPRRSRLNVANYQKLTPPS